MIEAGRTLRAAKAFAAQRSLEHPGKYVTLYACFGLYAQMSSSLHVFAPSDSVGGVYWLNGLERPFTDSQHGEDQRATPALS